MHFSSERDDRRRQIADAICDLPVQVSIYDARTVPRRDGRPVALRRIVADLAAHRVQRLVIEQDDSVLELDQRVLYEAVRSAGVEQTLSYEHLRPKTEPLFWIPDAIAWCWRKGPTWQARVESTVTGVVQL